MMKMKNLIEYCKTFNPDADVTLVDSEDITLSYIEKDVDGNVFKKETTPIVFIEGIDFYQECESEYISEDIKKCSFRDSECIGPQNCDNYNEFNDP